MPAKLVDSCEKYTHTHTHTSYGLLLCLECQGDDWFVTSR